MAQDANLDGPAPSIEESRPTFVVGCPRSGTTLVRVMLDAHPNISCGPESLFLRHIADLERRHLQLDQFLVTQEEWDAHLRDLFVWLHAQRASQLGKTRWVDKSPSYAMIPDFLDRLFPDCQLVHVVRDPRDVVDSWRRRWGLRSCLRATRTWRMSVQRARRFGVAHPDRYFEVRYEELVQSPEPVMRKLIEWLGEPWDARVMEFASFPPEGNRPGRKRAKVDKPAEASRAGALAPTSGPPSEPLPTPAPSAMFATSIGAGRRLSNLPVELFVRRSCGPLMRELGYQ